MRAPGGLRSPRTGLRTGAPLWLRIEPPKRRDGAVDRDVIEQIVA